MKRKLLAILVAVAGAWTARADYATTLKYDAVPAHVSLTFSGNFDGDFSQSVTGAVAGATLSRYSYGSRGWTIAATADPGYETPTFKTCPYDDSTGDNLSAAQSHTGTATVVGYNVHVYDVAAPARQARVQFNLSGGTGEADSKTVTYGSTYGTLPTPARVGYTFDGWYTASEGGARVTESTPVTITATQNLYAHWTPIRYVVAFAANGGSGTMPQMTLTYDRGTNLTANAFTRANYTFNRWRGEDGYLYADRARVENLTATAGAVVTFAAQWTPVSYTITFDSDGGSAVSPVSKAFGASVSAPSRPTRAGYDFVRWDPALPATMPPRDLAVKAVWRAKSYTVTYDSAGGSAIPARTQFMGTTVASPVPTREGYTFAGWSPALPATMPASDLAVTAQWTTNSYTVAFDLGGGSGLAPVTHAYGTAVTLPATAPTREGYTFAGWTSDLPATMPASDVTLTARWTVNTYTITFNAAGGSSVDPVTLDYGADVATPDAPTREGYTFAGWTPELPATMPARNLAVTARWTANECTVAFDANGGSGTMNPMTLTYNRSAYLTANAFTRADHAFAGWQTADGTAYADRAAVSNLAAAAGAVVTLYAQWTAKAFTVTFDPAGGSSVSPVTQAIGAAVTPPAAPTRAGYAFVRWEPALPATMPPRNLTVKAVWRVSDYTITFNAAGGSAVSPVTQLCGTTVKAPSDPVRAGYAFAGWTPALPATMPASNLTVTARWTDPAHAQALTFDANGGDGGETMAAMTAPAGSALTLPTCAFTRTGHAFAGWNTKPDGSGTTYASGKTMVLSGAATLYARWVPYPVTFSLSEGGFTQASIDAMMASGSISNVVQADEHTLRAFFTEGRPFDALPAATNRDDHFSFTVKNWRFEQDGVYQAVTADMIAPPLAGGSMDLAAQWAWEPSDELAAALDVTNLAVSIDQANFWTADNQQTTYGGSSVLIQANDYDYYAEKYVKLTTSLVGSGMLTFDWRMESAEIGSYSELEGRTKWQNTFDQLMFYNGEVNTLDISDLRDKFICGFSSDSNNWLSVTNYEGTGSSERPLADLSSTGGWKSEEINLTNVEIGKTNKVTWLFGYWGNPPWPARVWIDNIRWTGSGTVEPPADNTWQVAFDANGGEGTMASLDVDDADGTNLTACAFARAGNVFAGWNTHSNGTGLALADCARLALSTNVTLYAQWSTNAFAVTLDPANGAAPTVLSFAVGASVVAPEPARTGYTFAGWTPALPAAMPASNLTATAEWTANLYTVSFDLGEGGSGLDAFEQEFGTAVVLPTTPSRTGYAFAGWTPAPPATMPASNVTLRATWEAVPYSLTFDVAGGSEVPTITQAYGTSVTAPAEPTRTGYAFAGWSADPPATMPAGDVTLTAQWTVNSYTLTFDAAGGSAVAPVTRAYGAEVVAPTAPTRAGYTFAGWTPALPVTMPASNLTLTAEWTTNAYAITFDAAGGTDVAPLTADYGAEVVAPAAPTRAGYTFAGWTPALPATMPASNVTATARWTANPFVITFDAAGGSAVPPATNACGSAVTAPTAPTRAGYAFAGWTPELPATMPASNLTATAQWTEDSFTIAFDLGDGGSGLDAFEQAFGTAVVLPVTAPARTGYVFAGWSPALPAEMPASNVTLVATWTREIHSIVFDTADGTEIPAITQEYGTRVTAPADPVREGFVFAGWTPALPATMPANDLSVTARWTTNTYTITFNTAGGSAVPPATNAFGSAVTAPAAPTRAGYAFAGWTPALPETMPASNLTVTAQWTIRAYTITFDAAGGSAVAPITQAYGTRVTAPAAPTRTGYTFAGWTPALPATMPASNLTVRATWTRETTPEPVDPEPADLRLYESVESELVEGAATYDGYLYDAANNVVGVIQVKRAKYNVNKDLAKVTATVTLAGERKLSYKGGEWHLDSNEVTLTSAQDARALKVVLGRRGLAGTYGGYFIDGAVNPFASKDSAVKADGETVLGNVMSRGGVFVLAVPAENGWGSLTVAVKARGKASVKGTLADGTRVSVSSQLLIGEETCCVPVVSPKFAKPAFAIWLTRTGVPKAAVGIDGAKFAAARANLAAGARFAVDETALAAAIGTPLLTDYLPNGFSVEAVGTKWLVEDGVKAGQVKIDKKTGELTATSVNWAALKLTCKAKTGQFSGSFKAYAMVGGSLKGTTVKVAGVLVDGKGYGTATVKKKSAAVTIAPENN